jgi:hypothetical protein
MKFLNTIIKFIKYPPTVSSVVLWFHGTIDNIFNIILTFEFNSGAAILVWVNIFYIVFQIFEKVYKIVKNKYRIPEDPEDKLNA